MVILNALIGVILKITLVYASIFDLVNFISSFSVGIPLLNGIQNFILICSKDNICFLVENFGNLFYLISLSIYLIFFYHFDKNFRTSFLRLFNDGKKNIIKDAKS